RQSLYGILDIVKRATDYRRHSDDLRPLVVFPLPSRIEPARASLRDHWRFSAEVGYQPQFEQLFKTVYRLQECDLTEYFNEVQIQQIPDYAYGEQIAALIERSGDRLSLARSYDSFAERLTTRGAPWETPEMADLRKRDAREVASALADVLQAICLAFHVSRLVPEELAGKLSAEEHNRRFGSGTVVPPDRFHRIKGFC